MAANLSHLARGVARDLWQLTMTPALFMALSSLAPFAYGFIAIDAPYRLPKLRACAAAILRLYAAQPEPHVSFMRLWVFQGSDGRGQTAGYNPSAGNQY